MMLHCREFDVTGYSIIAGHDRETGKRYFVQEVSEATVQDLPCYLWDTIPALKQIQSIFWIKETNL